MDDERHVPDRDAHPSAGEANPIERRLVMRLLRFWRDRAEPHEMPARGDIDLGNLPDFAPHCWIGRIGTDEKNIILETIGESFAIDQGPSLIGKSLAAAPAGTLIAHAGAYAANVVVYRVPMSFWGKFQHFDGRTLLYRSIILPLRTENGDMGYLLGAANYRALQE